MNFKDIWWNCITKYSKLILTKHFKKNLIFLNIFLSYFWRFTPINTIVWNLKSKQSTTMFWNLDNVLNNIAIFFFSYHTSHFVVW